MTERTVMMGVPLTLMQQAVSLLHCYGDTRDCALLGDQDQTAWLVQELRALVDAAAQSTLEPGWAFPAPTARKAHYFLAGDARSLCGRWGWRTASMADDQRDDQPDKCQLCRERLVRMLAIPWD